MKLLYSINLWEEFDDLLLGSEIIKMQNKNSNTFDEIKIIAQSGSDIKPNKEQLKHVDEYYKIPRLKRDPKNRAQETFEKYFISMRILSSYQRAYNKGVLYNCDFAIVNNADSWVLDINKIHKVLKDKKINESAVSLRIGKVLGTNIALGDFVPYYDDHFLIINIKVCKKLNLFNRDLSLYRDPIFLNYGGFHYMLQLYLEELVPKKYFNAYTDMSESYNHYGERSGMVIVPFQFQKDLSLMHANCHSFKKLHFLRAKMLEIYRLDQFENTSKYIKKYNSKKIKIVMEREKCFFKKNFFNKIMIDIDVFLKKMILKINILKEMKNFKNKKFYNYPGTNTLKYLQKDKANLPYHIAARID